MATKDWRQAAAEIRSRADFKNFLHRHAGMSLSAAREVVDAVCTSEESGEKGVQRLTLAGRARMVRDYREIEREKRAMIYSQVIDEAHEKVRLYEGPLPPVNDWVEVNGEKHLLDPVGQMRHLLALEMVSNLSKELDACKDNDELQAKLIAAGWDDDAADHYADRFGKGVAVGT